MLHTRVTRVRNDEVDAMVRFATFRGAGAVLAVATGCTVLLTFCFDLIIDTVGENSTRRASLSHLDDLILPSPVQWNSS